MTVAATRLLYRPASMASVTITTWLLGTDHLVAKQSPAQVSQVMKDKEAGNTGSQVNDADYDQQVHPHANRTHVRVAVQIRNAVFTLSDHLPYFNVSEGSVQHQNDDDATSD